MGAGTPEAKYQSTGGNVVSGWAVWLPDPQNGAQATVMKNKAKHLKMVRTTTAVAEAT